MELFVLTADGNALSHKAPATGSRKGPLATAGATNRVATYEGLHIFVLLTVILAVTAPATVINAPRTRKES